jgi:hypothetical protein
MQHECLATTAATLNRKDWTTLHPAIGPLGNVNDQISGLLKFSMVHRVDITFFADLLKLAHVICVWSACWYLIGHVVVVAVVICCCVLAGVLVFLYYRWQYMVVERTVVPPY